ncbi:hypothetical protein UlMin_003741 [Ulmus minor]
MAVNLATQQGNFNKFKNQCQRFKNQRPNYSNQNSTSANQSYNYRNGAKRNNNGGNRSQYNYKPTNPNYTNKMTAMIATLEMVTDEAWFMEGATHHVILNINNLTSTNPFIGNEKIAVGDGNSLSISHTGLTSFSFEKSINPLILKNVLYVPKMSSNLVSVSKLCLDNNVFIEFHPFFFVIKNSISKKVILQGKVEYGLYTFKPAKENFQPKASTFCCYKRLQLFKS